MRAVVLLAALPLARAGMRLVSSGDLAARITAEGEADSKAAERVGCFCRELGELLDERGRESTSEVNFLTNQRNQRHFENVGLRVEVQKYQQDASQHRQSLESGGAIAGAASADHEADRQFHKSALRATRKALDAVPEGSGGEVRGMLEALNQTFAEKLREAEEAHQKRSGAHEDALKEKQEMLRLAHEGANRTQSRVEANDAAVATADAKVSAYGAQELADGELRSAASSLCSAVEQQAQARSQLRHQALIALSQADVAAAQAAAAEARAGLVLAASPEIAGVDTLMARSSDLESKLASALTNEVSSLRLVQFGTLHADEKAKAAIASLGSQAESNLQAMQPLWGAMRSAGQRCSHADVALRAALSS